MIRRTLILLAAAAAMACASGQYDPNAPDTSPRTRYSGLEVGELTVGAIPDVVLRDNARNRDVTVSIDYPTRGGPHPLIVLSPAAGLSNREYVGLSSYWAANGYVVMRLASAEPAAQRARDVAFVLDSVEILEQRYPELQGKADRGRVGVAGHEAGAVTAMELGADARVNAVVAMTPPSAVDVRKPTLFIVPAPIVPPGQATATPVAPPLPEAFTRAPAGDKWAVVIQGARFQSFTGRLDDVTIAQSRAQSSLNDPMYPNDPRLTDPRGLSRVDSAALRQRELFAIVRGSALAFWDAYLKGDAAGRAALEKMTERRGVTVEKK